MTSRQTATLALVLLMKGIAAQAQPVLAASSIDAASAALRERAADAGQVAYRAQACGRELAGLPGLQAYFQALLRAQRFLDPAQLSLAEDYGEAAQTLHAATRTAGGFTTAYCLKLQTWLPSAEVEHAARAAEIGRELQRLELLAQGGSANARRRWREQLAHFLATLTAPSRAPRQSTTSR